MLVKLRYSLHLVCLSCAFISPWPLSTAQCDLSRLRCFAMCQGGGWRRLKVSLLRKHGSPIAFQTLRCKYYSLGLLDSYLVLAKHACLAHHEQYMRRNRSRSFNTHQIHVLCHLASHSALKRLMRPSRNTVRPRSPHEKLPRGVKLLVAKDLAKWQTARRSWKVN